MTAPSAKAGATDKPTPRSRTVDGPAKPTVAKTPVAPPKLVVAAPGPAYFVVDGAGVAALHKGRFKRAIPKASVANIAVGPKGEIWVAGISGVYRVERGKARKVGDLRTIGSTRAIAVSSKGEAWTTSFKGVSHFTTAWSLEKKSDLAGATLLNDIVVDANDRPWMVSSDFVYRRDDDGWKKLDTSAVTKAKPFFKNLAVGADGSIYVSGNGGVIRHKDGAWTRIDVGTSYHGADMLAVGPNGQVVVTSGFDVHILNPGSPPLHVTAGSAGYTGKSIRALAVDANGRVWLGTDNGVVILSPGGQALQQWLPGSVPEITGTVKAIALVAGGPKLPTLGERIKGGVSGRVLKNGAGVANAVVEICESPLTMFQRTPCGSASFKKSVKTDAKGAFHIYDVPVGSYGFAVKPKSKWMILIGGKCCQKIHKGKVFDVGAITLN